MTGARVYQFHSGSASGDAVTGALLYIQDILESYSIRSEIYVEHRDPQLAQQMSLIGTLHPEEDDLLVIHHSMGHDIMPLLAALECKKLLIYHNITPPDFFEQQSPFRHYARLGLHQLSQLRDMTRGAIADSQFNADQLKMRGFGDVTVIPLLRDFAALRHHPHDPSPYYFEAPRRQLLFVGRICANKGQLHLVRFMERYRDAFDYPLHLTFVGHFQHAEGYAAQLIEAIDRAGLNDRIQLAGHVTDEALYGHYRAADAYVSHSEHEGFGVPLVEAMVFDVPVVAYDSSAISGTLGEAGVRLSTTDPDELAGHLWRLFHEPAWRRETIQRQRRRLMNFDRDLVAAQLLHFLGPHLPPGCVPRQSFGAARPARSQASRHYVIEGPCETSYSLAIVNRNLALALDARPGTATTIEPAEGVPGYRLSAEGLRAYPELGPLLDPLPLSPEATHVSIRNMFPLRPAGMTGDYRLAHFFWEESEIPWRLTRLINRYLDGLVAPTEFVRRVYRNSGVRKPAVVVGLGVEHRTLVRNIPRSEQLSRPFVFVHVSSGHARKGIEELLCAYAMAFCRKDDVELVVKTHDNPNNVVRTLYDKIFAGCCDAPVVKLIFDDLDDEEMRVLYGQTDVIVLPTRGEGFNLPAAEAMALGVPVVTTGYSGQMDFCNSNNSYLVDYDFETTGSHLGNAQAMWVRARLDALSSRLRSIYEQRHSSDMCEMVIKARETVSSMSWMAAAEKVDMLVDALERKRPEKNKLKLAWVSTWNSRCGIAIYSEAAVEKLPSGWFDVTILANHSEKLRDDSPNVVRCWTDRRESLDRLIAQVIESRDDVVIFQYNYGFYTLRDLASAVSRLDGQGIDTYVVFHKTREAEIDGVIDSIGDVAQSMRLATRLIVHSLEDVNRLKSYGLVDNVVKMPLGAYHPQDIDRKVARQVLGLNQFGPIVASYGFLLPHKGIPELILAFSLFARRYPDALLLLVNALYSPEASQAELDKCRDLIDNLGLRNQIVLIPEFISNEESMLLLQSADILVFPYQHTGESASAAVRFGLSSLRPILATPLSIFDDVRDLVALVEGVRPQQIAEGLTRLFEDPAEQKRLIQVQRLWLEEHSFQQMSERLANMIIGLYEDRHNVCVRQEPSLQPPLQLAAAGLGMQDKSWIDALENEALLRMIYQRILGRDPGADDLAHYLPRLRDRKESRMEIVSEIENSNEAQVLRGPVADGVVPFAELDRGDDEVFVKRTYLRLLGRAVDDTGLKIYVEKLASGKLNRSEVVNAILSSEEFLLRNRSIRVTYAESAEVQAGPPPDQGTYP